jgi:hypothetical protein
LSDYNSRKKKQTCLENSELDNMVRSLKPDLYAKIVDACHSGTSYIKGKDDLSVYLKSAQPGLNTTYFLFSSQSDQFSYQDDRISYFTESVLNAIRTHKTQSIRYKDVIDYVSDDFESLGFQTPLFVAQARFTEDFLQINHGVRSALEQFGATGGGGGPLKDTAVKEVPTLLEVVKADAETYCTKEEAISITAALKSDIPNPLSEAVAPLFDFQVEVVESAADLEIDTVAIGRWLKQGREERGYFAQEDTDTETYRKKVLKRQNALLSNWSRFLTGFEEGDYTYVDAERTIVTGFDHSSEMPFAALRLYLKPRTPNITPEECTIVVVLSRTHLRLFWSFYHFEYTDWDSASRVGKPEWATSEAPLKDKTAVENLLKSVLDKFSAFVEEPIKARWLPAPPALPAGVPEADQGEAPDSGSNSGSEKEPRKRDPKA